MGNTGTHVSTSSSLIRVHSILSNLVGEAVTLHHGASKWVLQFIKLLLRGNQLVILGLVVLGELSNVSFLLMLQSLFMQSIPLLGLGEEPFRVLRGVFDECFFIQFIGVGVPIITQEGQGFTSVVRFFSLVGVATRASSLIGSSHGGPKLIGFGVLVQPIIIGRVGSVIGRQSLLYQLILSQVIGSVYQIGRGSGRSG